MKSRNTKTKMLVSSIFEQSEVPLLMTEVFERVQKAVPNVAYSTIYRIVQNLHEAGTLVAIDWRERGSRYEWAHKTHHHHLVCNSCGEVADVDDELLQFSTQAVAQKTGFFVKDHSIELFGECSSCQRST